MSLTEKFPPLQFPTYPLKLKQHDNKIYVWDDLRKKNLVLTPEEWVRQHCVHYLISELGYPKEQIALEGMLKVNGMDRRFDILVYRKSKPVILIECKAASVKIDQKVFDQIAQYNLTLNVPHLWVSNGLVHYFAQIDYAQQSYHFLKELPTYESI